MLKSLSLASTRRDICSRAASSTAARVTSGGSSRLREGSWKSPVPWRRGVAGGGLGLAFSVTRGTMIGSMRAGASAFFGFLPFFLRVPETTVGTVAFSSFRSCRHCRRRAMKRPPARRAATVARAPWTPRRSQERRVARLRPTRNRAVRSKVAPVVLNQARKRAARRSPRRPPAPQGKCATSHGQWRAARAVPPPRARRMPRRRASQ